jgi:ankyrin repeat protein
MYRWDESFVDEALAKDIDHVTPEGVTALWHAVYFGKTEHVARLLEAGARLDAHDPERIDRVAGDSHVISIWRGVPDPGYAAPTGKSSLLHVAAARIGSVDITRLLLDRGLDVDARDAFGDTPLHIAAFSQSSVELLTLLIDRGADPNAIDRAGYGPLDHAWHKVDVAKALLARGSDPNGGPKTRWGNAYEWSPITNAAYGGRLDVLRLLLDAGADISRHREALPLAAKHGQAGAVRVLLEKGAPLDGTTDWRGKDRRPLASAAMYASLACLELLYPVCEDQRDEALATAIELSSDDHPNPPNDRRADRIEVVRWLLERGADPSNALFAAAQSEDETYMTMLLDRGARVDVVDESGETPLIKAALWGRHRAAKLLLAKGADPHARAADGKSAYETAEYAYRQLDFKDARLVMNALADAGAGPPPPPPPPKPSGPQKGDRVTHAKFGGGAIVAIEGEKLTIAFDTAGTKTLLAKFVTLA